MSAVHSSRFSVAPMMDCTDRHDRYFLRLIARRCLLYTEMITTAALLRGETARLLRFDDTEHPLALQLGGSDPGALAQCSAMAEEFGYDEVNLNVGCPSPRVQEGRFGACLMGEPLLVARCVEAMRAACRIPVTVKTRIGIDNDDTYTQLKRFVAGLQDVGIDRLVVHARKAWLSGLSPKQNREIPPLRYDTVYRLQQDFPTLPISLNGGIVSLEDAKRHLAHVHGVMLGREIYRNPYLLADVDQMFFGDDRLVLTRAQVVEEMCSYIDRELENGVRLGQIARHMLGLYQHLPGAKLWRRNISERAFSNGATSSLLLDAVAQMHFKLAG